MTDNNFDARSGLVASERRGADRKASILGGAAPGQQIAPASTSSGALAEAVFRPQSRVPKQPGGGAVCGDRLVTNSTFHRLHVRDQHDEVDCARTAHVTWKQDPDGELDQFGAGVGTRLRLPEAVPLTMARDDNAKALAAHSGRASGSMTLDVEGRL